MRTATFGPAAPRVPGGQRVDVSSLVRDDGGAYRAAADAYARWRRAGWIAVAPQRRRWVLRVDPGTGAAGEQSVEGLVGALALDAAVHPHEQTDEAVTARRAARLSAVPLDLSPVSTYAARPSAAVDRAVARSSAGRPALDVRDEAGARFRLWPLVAGGDLEAELADLQVVVADGHHRVAAAIAAHAAGGALGPARTLATVWRRPPASQATHRLLSGDVAAARRRIEELARPVGEPGPPADVARRLPALPGTVVVGLVVAPEVAVPLALEVQPPGRRDTPAARSLVDHVVIHEELLPQLDDIAVQPVADLPAVQRGVADGGLGLLLRPVLPEVVTRLALAGSSLPPKTTSFRPKPRTGLFARALEPQEAGPR